MPQVLRFSTDAAGFSGICGYISSDTVFFFLRKRICRIKGSSFLLPSHFLLLYHGAGAPFAMILMPYLFSLLFVAAEALEFINVRCVNNGYRDDVILFDLFAAKASDHNIDCFLDHSGIIGN